MKFLGFLPTLLIPSVLFSQVRFQDENTQKWGVHDYEWNILIPAVYDGISQIADTVFVVNKDGKMAAFDNKGKVRIPLEYQKITFNSPPFKSQYGYAAVTKNKSQRNSWGMLDAKGKVVLPEKFQYVWAVSPDLLVGRMDGNQKLQFFNAKGNLLYEIAGKGVIPIDMDNTCYGVPGWDYATRYYKADGSLVDPENPKRAVWTDGERVVLWRGQKCGMINSKKEIVIPFEFLRIRPGLPGQFIVEQQNGPLSSFLMGVYDKQGNPVIPVKQILISTFGNMYRIYDKINENGGLYSATGAEILSVDHYFSKVRVVENKYDDVISGSRPDRYILAKAPFSRYVFLVRDDGLIVRPKNADRISYYADNLPLIVSSTTEDGFQSVTAYDFTGKQLLQSDYFTLSVSSNPKILWGKKKNGDKYGFIKLTAPERTEFKYDLIGRMKNGYILAKVANKFELYDAQLKLVHSGTYGWVHEPREIDYKQFQIESKIKEKLIACAFRKGMANEELLAVTQSKTFIFKNAKPIVPGHFETLLSDTPDDRIRDEVPNIVVPIDSSEIAWTPPNMDQPAQFPGGESACARFLGQNLQYPPLAVEKSIEGVVFVQFVVEKDGSFSNISVLKDIGGGCGEEAVRLVQAMPKWIPGQNGGIILRTACSMPIRFKLK